MPLVRRIQPTRVQQAFRFLQEQRHQQETEHICLSTNSSRFIYNHLHSEAKKCQQSTMVDLDSKRREWKLITRSPLLAMRSLPGVGSSSTPHGFTRRTMSCRVGAEVLYKGAAMPRSSGRAGMDSIFDAVRTAAKKVGSNDEVKIAPLQNS